MKMRKLFAALLAVLMLCSIVPFTAVAESASATITFDNVSKRTELDADHQVWQENGITVINNKDASSSNVVDYAKPARFYKNSTLIVEYPGMTKIEFVCNTAAYATALQSSIGANAAAADKVVTVTLSGTDSFSCVLSGGQVRLDSLTVYGEGGAPVEPDEPDEPDTPDTPDEPDTPGVPTSFATIDFTDVGNRTALSTAQQVWKQNGITVTNDKGDSTSNVADYSNPARFYKSSTVTIAYPGMTKIVIEGDQANSKDYAAPWSNSFSGNATATVDGTTVTIVLAAAADSFTWETLTAQARAYSITVYAGDESTTPDVPVEPDTPVDPEPDTPDTPDEPDEPNYDEDIDTTIPYLLGMIQENVSTEDVYFLNGEMDGYYMATTTDEESAIWVYLEKTNGGYYLYALDEDDAKVYINMVVSGTHVNGVYEYTASTVYNYDWDLYTLVAEVNDDVYAFGTRNDKTYTTMGPVKVSYNGFHADLYYFEDDAEESCEHEYDHACDDECNLCGDLREVGDHEYSDATDAECNNCGFVRDLPIYGGAIYVDNQSAHAGDTVEVKVQVDNNPGIISAKVRVYFDTTLLEFVSFAEGNFSDSGYSWSDPDVAQEKGYVVINWCEATKPNSTANLLAILTFKVKEDAAEGSYAALTVEFNCDADMFNAADKTVYFDAVSGGVEIVAAPVEPDSGPGDANGDGDINNRDLALLQQHINGWDVTIAVEAMDVNNDGDVNNRDLALLQQYINGWDVTLG